MYFSINYEITTKYIRHIDKNYREIHHIYESPYINHINK